MDFIDLFSGAGGFSEGLIQAGHTNILSIDSWEPALRTHELNHPEAEYWLEDVKNITSLPECDLIVGGPPCQSFSYMGKRKGLDSEKGQLIHQYIRLVKLSKAKYILFENVPGLLNKNDALQFIQNSLSLRIKKINYAEYGIPTIRERIFGSNFGFPDPINNPYARFFQFTNKPTQEFLNSSKNLLGIDDDFFFIRRKTNSQNGTPLRSIDKPAWTILGGHNNDLYVARRLLVEEFLVLQGFPINYKFPSSVSKRDIIQMIANSVSPIIAFEFGQMLNLLLNKQNSLKPIEFGFCENECQDEEQNLFIHCIHCGSNLCSEKCFKAHFDYCLYISALLRAKKNGPLTREEDDKLYDITHYMSNQDMNLMINELDNKKKKLKQTNLIY